MYDRPVARQEQLYAGELTLDGGDRVFGEVWHSSGTAVVHTLDKKIIGPMRSARIGTAPDGQLQLVGEVMGREATWRAVTPERVEATYRDTEVMLADGSMVKGIVTQTNHAVTIANGSKTVTMPGAKVRTLGGRAARIEGPGATLTMQLPKRGCGCGGGS